MDHFLVVQVLQNLSDLSYEKPLHVHAEPFEVAYQKLFEIAVATGLEGH